MFLTLIAVMLSLSNFIDEMKRKVSIMEQNELINEMIVILLKCHNGAI
jgi:hypothetical protein